MTELSSMYEKKAKPKANSSHLPPSIMTKEEEANLA
jgi:hypothetical protein